MHGDPLAILLLLQGWGVGLFLKPLPPPPQRNSKGQVLDCKQPVANDSNFNLIVMTSLEIN